MARDNLREGVVTCLVFLYDKKQSIPAAETPREGLTITEFLLENLSLGKHGSSEKAFPCIG